MSSAKRQPSQSPQSSGERETNKLPSISQLPRFPKVINQPGSLTSRDETERSRGARQGSDPTAVPFLLPTASSAPFIAAVEGAGGVNFGPPFPLPHNMRSDPDMETPGMRTISDGSPPSITGAFHSTAPGVPKLTKLLDDSRKSAGASASLAISGNSPFGFGAGETPDDGGDNRSDGGPQGAAFWSHTALGDRNLMVTSDDLKPRRVVEDLTLFIRSELDRQGLLTSPPSIERVRVFGQAYEHLLKQMPTYRPVLSAIKKEYDALVDNLWQRTEGTTALQSRLQVMRHETLAFFGRSHNRLKEKLLETEDKLADTKRELSKTSEELTKTRTDSQKMKEERDQAKAQAAEINATNTDLVRSVQRTMEQHDQVRKAEQTKSKELQQHQQKLSDAKRAIESLERKVEEERDIRKSMIAPETYEAEQAACRNLHRLLREEKEKYANLERDFHEVERLYQESRGDMKPIRRDQRRPLTPRPDWTSVADLQGAFQQYGDAERSFTRAEELEDIAEHLFLRARSIIYNYGARFSSERCSLLQRQDSDPPPTGDAQGGQGGHRNQKGGDKAGEKGQGQQGAAAGAGSGLEAAQASASRAAMARKAMINDVLQSRQRTSREGGKIAAGGKEKSGGDKPGEVETLNATMGPGAADGRMAEFGSALAASSFNPDATEAGGDGPTGGASGGSGDNAQGSSSQASYSVQLRPEANLFSKMDVAAEKSDKDAGEPPPLALELRRRTELRLKPLLLLFPACMDEALPQVLRHAEKIDNLNMSRKTAKEFLDKFLCERRRSGLQHLPFFAHLLERLPKHLEGTKKTQWILSLLEAVERYSAEPDFLCFSLLIDRQLPEWVVDENRSLCRRILGMMRKFAAESGDVSGYEEDQPPLMMSKDVFFEKMQGIYERKPERNWRHLQSAMPAVTKDTSIDVISLLADDLYLPSPFAYSLRMQHLEERVELLEKFQGDLRKTLEVTGSTSGSATSLEIAEALGTLQLTTGVHAHPELIIKRGFAKPDGDYPGDDETVTLEHFVHNLRLYPLFPALPTESSPDSTHTSMNAGGGARSTGRSLVGGAGGAYAGVGGSAALSGGARGGDGGGDDFTL